MPGAFFNPLYAKSRAALRKEDWIKQDHSKCEMIEEGDGYFIYYKPYSKIAEKLTKRAGNVFVCILKPKKSTAVKEYWIEYSDREWPKMSTIPEHIRERALAFRTFYTLKEKLIART